jgi:hypothetical protein
MRRPPQGDDEGRIVAFEPHDLTGSLPHPKWLRDLGMHLIADASHD